MVGTFGVPLDLRQRLIAGAIQLVDGVAALGTATHAGLLQVIETTTIGGSGLLELMSRARSPKRKRRSPQGGAFFLGFQLGPARAGAFVTLGLELAARNTHAAIYDALRLVKDL